MTIWLPTIPIILGFALVIGIILIYGDNIKFLKPLKKLLEKIIK